MSIKEVETKVHKRDNYLEFYEAVAANYPEEDLVYTSLRGRVREIFVRKHLLEFSGCLLDLGCNRGAYLASYNAGKRIGIDISLQVLKIAKARTASASYIQGDAQNMAFLKSASVDCILCSEMIEHVSDPQTVLAECYRLLRHGGKLLITTPNYKTTKPTWIQIGRLADYGVSGVKGDTYYHTAFRPEELAEMARAAGFCQINVGTFEKEVKYATRLPMAIFYTVDYINKRTFGINWLDKINRKQVDVLSMFIYRAFSSLGLNDILCQFVREGVRTFLLARK